MAQEKEDKPNPPKRFEPEPTTSTIKSPTEKVRPPWRVPSQEQEHTAAVPSPTKTSSVEPEPPGPPPRPKPRTVLTSKFEEIRSREKKESVVSPEPRISAMFDFGLTEQEERVMLELEQMRKNREEAGAVDYRNVPDQVDGGDIKYEAVAPYVKEGGSKGGSKMTTPLMTRKQLTRPFDSDSDEEKPKPEAATGGVEMEAIKSLAE